MIEVQKVTQTYHSFTALHSVDLTIHNGEFIAILGPSGCGKTTLLKLLAGFMKPVSGKIVMDTTVVASKSKLVPPEKRNIGMVFQSFALWPHMTVYQHVKFPLLHHPYTAYALKGRIEERVHDVLSLVGLEKLSNRYPAQLSGGQKQRVAFARAIAHQPNLLLMDEPLSALDAELRMDMRKEIQKIHRQTHASIVYVTHDQSEALAMADKIVVMNNGKIEQAARPEVIYTKPETEFVAKFVGKCNIIKGTWTNDVFIPEQFPLERWPDIGVSVNLKQKGIYPVRPEQWQLTKDHNQVLNGVITFVQYQGKEIHYTVEVKNDIWTVHDSVHSSRFYVGDRVNLSVKTKSTETVLI
ncbi:ABC transporter ATP-binding protein [Bacillus aquiflavi]|uniref:Carnitine transport ATP-binding protein OpuCA n=1 Tax=Bacillus aquiflavi TaxID=2672567 RepID=A0A6B3VS98_9BACI|nr:ABC transporter ATP-binding protein [Bacillus aquiflavi]MBA4536773.1 ABC transporter ATP-binding protein [Bacillus aquiflavi]NEY81140.1 ABC transporter ATP-binding protein [Bacillus aquiflavi]